MPAVVSGYTGSPTVTAGVAYRGLTGTLYEWNAAGSGSITFSTGGAIYALLVGGGGAGGADGYGETGGGGGGGGVLEQEITATATAYSLTIGAGGVAGIPGTSDPTTAGNTTGFSLTALGGGHGAGDGQYSRYDASSGGSGGGGGAGLNQTAGTGTSGQGNAGGAGTSDHRNGGGGGAGSTGEGGVGHANERGGYGGIGRPSLITGQIAYYGGGGGGSHLLNRTEPRNIGGLGGGGNGFRGTTTYAQSGTDGLGGGGGGSVYYATSSSRVAGDGGDGTLKVFVPDGGTVSDWHIVDFRDGRTPDGANVAFDLTAMEWADGDLGVLVSAVGTTTASATPGVSESGWTTRADVWGNDTRDTALGVFTRKLVGSDTTVTALGTGNTNQTTVAMLYILRNVDADAPMDVTPVTSNGGDTAVPTFGSITPSAAGTPVLAIATGANAAGRATRYSQSGLAGFSSLGADDSADAALGAGWHEWTSGAYTPGAWALEGDIDSASDSYATALIAFKLAPAGPTDTVAKCDAAAKVGSTVGKAHFIKHPSTDVAEGETLRFQTCFYLSTETSANFDGLKILDFENNDISGNPGFRIQVYNSGAYWGVTVNQDKLNGPVTTSYGVVTPDVLDQGLTFDTPHLIDVEVLVGGDTAEEAGDTTDGHVKIWLDGALVLDQDMRTTVTQAYWTGEGLPGTITAHVSSIQVGVTANSDETYNAVMYLGSSALLLPGDAWDLFSTWEEDPVTTGWTSTVTSSGSALTAVDAPATMIEPTMPAVGSGAVSAAPATVSGAGSVTRKGSGGVASGAVAVSGAGAVERKGSGAITAGASTVSGAGKRTVAGAGAIATRATTVSGAGEGQTNGSGAINTGAATVSGSGTRTVTGAGVITAPAATVDASGSVVGAVSGSGAISTAAPSVAGSGVRAVTGSGALTVGAAAVSGEGLGADQPAPPSRGGWGVREEDADEGARRAAQQRRESRDARSEAVRRAIEALNKAPEPDRPLPAKVVRRVAKDAARELVSAGELADLQAAIDRMEAVARQYWADMRAEREAALRAERRRIEADRRARLARDDDDILALLLVA